MAEQPKQPLHEPRKRSYAPPKLETVEVSAEEALLAVCAFSSSTPGNVFQGAPCDMCFNGS